MTVSGSCVSSCNFFSSLVLTCWTLLRAILLRAFCGIRMESSGVNSKSNSKPFWRGSNSNMIDEAKYKRILVIYCTVTCHLLRHREDLFYMFAEIREVLSSYSLVKGEIKFLSDSTYNIGSVQNMLFCVIWMLYAVICSLNYFCVRLYFHTILCQSFQSNMFQFLFDEIYKYALLLLYFFFAQWTSLKNVLFKVIKIMFLSGI